MGCPRGLCSGAEECSSTTGVLLGGLGQLQRVGGSGFSSRLSGAAAYSTTTAINCGSHFCAQLFTCYHQQSASSEFSTCRKATAVSSICAQVLRLVAKKRPTHPLLVPGAGWVMPRCCGPGQAPGAQTQASPQRLLVRPQRNRPDGDATIYLLSLLVDSLKWQFFWALLVADRATGCPGGKRLVATAVALLLPSPPSSASLSLALSR